MATFKVGQRVRVVDPGHSQHGKEGVVMEPATFTATYRVSTGERRPPHWAYPVAVSGDPSPHPTGWWWRAASELAPLTDPRADAFIESIKKLAREPRLPVTTPAFGD